MFVKDIGFDITPDSQRFLELLIQIRFPSYKVNDIVPWHFTFDAFSEPFFTYNPNVLFFGHIFFPDANGQPHVVLHDGLSVTSTRLFSTIIREDPNYSGLDRYTLPPSFMLFDDLSPNDLPCSFIGWKISFDNPINTNTESPPGVSPVLDSGEVEFSNFAIGLTFSTTAADGSAVTVTFSNVKTFAIPQGQLVFSLSGGSSSGGRIYYYNEDGTLVTGVPDVFTNGVPFSFSHLSDFVRIFSS